MPISRESISAPLEAGTSLQASQHIPARLTKALEYLSSRLARKQLELTLIVVKNESQSGFRRSFDVAQPNSPSQSFYNGEVSPAFSTCSSSSSTTSLSSASSTKSHSRTQYPSLPASPRSFKTTSSSPPSTPLPRTPSCVTPTTLNPYNITLFHASTLTPRAERVLRNTIEKASRKFGIGNGWLALPSSTMTIPSTAFGCLTNDLIRLSLQQNEVVYKAEGLTLLSLDHVYQFKLALSHYSKSTASFGEEEEALQEATDALHRLVLAQGGKSISKGYLLRAYDHLAITSYSISSVNAAYQVSYGGPSRRSGIAIINSRQASSCASPSSVPLPPSPVSQASAPTVSRPKTPRQLFLLQDVKTARENKEKMKPTLNEKLDTLPLLQTKASAERVGPVTPNGFEDITPVTRGEWCFLMVGEGWREAKRAEVVTC